MLVVWMSGPNISIFAKQCLMPGNSEIKLYLSVRSEKQNLDLDSRVHICKGIYCRNLTLYNCGCC